MRCAVSEGAAGFGTEGVPPVVDAAAAAAADATAGMVVVLTAYVAVHPTAVGVAVEPAELAAAVKPAATAGFVVAAAAGFVDALMDATAVAVAVAAAGAKVIGAACAKALGELHSGVAAGLGAGVLCYAWVWTQPMRVVLLDPRCLTCGGLLGADEEHLAHHEMKAAAADSTAVPTHCCCSNPLHRTDELYPPSGGELHPPQIQASPDVGSVHGTLLASGATMLVG